MMAHGKLQEQQKLHSPQTLFPCASGVTMPQLGAEDSQIGKGLRKALVDHLALKPIPLDHSPVDRRYLKKICTEMKFEEDVVKERCFHMMPYDTKYLAEVLDASDIVAARPKVRQLVGRHNAHGSDLRHKPCGLKTTKPPSSLKPLKKKIARKALAMSSAAQGETSSCDSPSSSQSGTDKAAQKPAAVVTFMTPVTVEEQAKPQSPETLQELQGKLKALRDAAAKKEEEQKKPRSARLRAEKNQKDWDAYLMSQLSQLTATWIVHERMCPNRQREELQKILEEWYGKPKHTDLIQEEESDSEDESDILRKDKKVKPKKKWKKSEESLLERVYHLSPCPKLEANDPYSDDNKAPFYRQPAGIRRQHKRFEKEEAGNIQEQMLASAINATAHRIKVRSVKPPKLRTLRDFLPKGVGSTLYDSQNQYEQELLTGVPQMHPARGDGSILVMASDHKYQKVLRHDYPEAPETWYPATEKEKEAKKHHAAHQPIKREHGAKRWRALPEPYDDTFEAQKVVPPGFIPPFQQSWDQVEKRKLKQNSTLGQILHDWRSKWSLSGQFADATFDDIIKDMADIQPHVRLKAIATIGKAAEYKPHSNQGINLSSQNQQDNTLAVIPEKVYVALDCLLGDMNDQVRRAAAITLYALERPTDKAEKILRKALESNASVERWSAVQCLAHFGVCDSQVVDEIIRQLLFSEDAVKHEQGIALLSKISNGSMLVHCMVAEQLNSSSWRHRVVACKILPTLHGSINKDVMHKLLDLMWNDWHTEVRRAAAHCLGKTCHGRDVHDEICRCIMYGNERTKLEAISRLGQLGIMTTKLLPAFLQCFEEKYVAIRCECCITAGNLRIKEDRVLEKLVFLATFDPLWKVKALSIQALGKIGVVTESIKDCLLWAMRYEEKEAVRAEACHSLMVLEMMDDDVILVLQERLLVESSQVVRDEMVKALQMVGLSATEDMDMVTQIKGEVRKLCKRNIIASQIVLNEADEQRQQNLNSMIYMSQEEIRMMKRHVNRTKYLNMLQGEEFKEYLQMKRRVMKEKLLKEKDEVRKESALKRVREFASASEFSGTQHSASSHPASKDPVHEDEFIPPYAASTPDPCSREGTMFSPSTDKELQAILNRDDVTLQPSRESSFKTHPSRESSIKSHTVISETELTSGTYASPPISSSTSKPSLTEDYVYEDDLQLPRVTIQEALLHPLAITPARSRMEMTTSASVHAMESQLSMVQVSGRRTVYSPDTIQEMENLNDGIAATYEGLSVRYTDIDEYLARMDRGLITVHHGPSHYLSLPGETISSASSTNQSVVTTTQDAGNDNHTSESVSMVFSMTDGTDPSSSSMNQEEADGQVAVSLEVSLSEHQSLTSQRQGADNSNMHESQSSFSTEYPTLLADDMPPSDLDVSRGENVPHLPSTYVESTSDPLAQASEYRQSNTYEDDDQSILDE